MLSKFDSKLSQIWVLAKKQNKEIRKNLVLEGKRGTLNGSNFTPLNGQTRQFLVAKTAILEMQTLPSFYRLKQLDALYAKMLADYH